MLRDPARAVILGTRVRGVVASPGFVRETLLGDGRPVCNRNAMNLDLGGSLKGSAGDATGMAGVWDRLETDRVGWGMDVGCSTRTHRRGRRRPEALRASK